MATPYRRHRNEQRGSGAFSFAKNAAPTALIASAWRHRPTRRDEKHLRALDPPARDTLNRLLGDRQNWFVGFIDSALPVGVREVGVLFRTRTDELLLFIDSDTISVSFRGHWYGGGLISRRVNDLYDWKRTYARLELERK